MHRLIDEPFERESVKEELAGARLHLDRDWTSLLNDLLSKQVLVV
jgi:hypothetical protein